MERFVFAKEGYLTAKKRQKEHQLPVSRDVQRFRRNLLRWFAGHGRKFPWRKASASDYKLIVAELLLQRTRAETVASFFPQFVREFPSWKRLSSASRSRLQSYLQPIGLWRRRAASIQALAQEMVKRRGRFPEDRDEIEALPGIGQYIASAVLLLCHDVPEPLVDVNMARVLERVYQPRRLADIRYDPYLQSLARRVVACKSSKEVSWAILDLAALVCVVDRPRCDVCPLATLCSFKATQAHRQEETPTVS